MLKLGRYCPRKTPSSHLNAGDTGTFFCSLPCALILTCVPHEVGTPQPRVLTAEVKCSSRKIALTARDGEKNMKHDSFNIFFKLLLKYLL